MKQEFDLHKEKIKSLKQEEEELLKKIEEKRKAEQEKQELKRQKIKNKQLKNQLNNSFLKWIKFW